ncbi:MAG: hypothetical protein F4Z31_02255 [Gemmatimonadetes bacterium]|nr:hypothetical protein [Gemmatimonadota bacterium]
MSVLERARTAAVRALVSVGTVAAYAMLAATGLVASFLLDAAMLTASPLVVTGTWLPLLIGSGAVMCVAAWLFALSMRARHPVAADKEILFLEGALVGALVLAASLFAGVGVYFRQQLPHNPGWGGLVRRGWCLCYGGCPDGGIPHPSDPRRCLSMGLAARSRHGR